MHLPSLAHRPEPWTILAFSCGPNWAFAGAAAGTGRIRLLRFRALPHGNFRTIANTACSTDYSNILRARPSSYSD